MSLPSATPNAQERAKKLRHRKMSQGEIALWSAFQESMGRWKWRRQVAIGSWVADFYCHRARVVIEVDGAQHWNDPETIARDKLKERDFGQRGLTIYRIPVWQVFDLPLNLWRERILDACKSPDRPCHGSYFWCVPGCLSSGRGCRCFRPYREGPPVWAAPDVQARTLTESDLVVLAEAARRLGVKSKGRCGAWIGNKPMTNLQVGRHVLHLGALEEDPEWRPVGYQALVRDSEWTSGEWAEYGYESGCLRESPPQAQSADAPATKAV